MTNEITLHNHPLPSHVQIQPLVFALNRKRITISPFDRSIPFDATLLEYLREHAHLPGTKLGCGEGGCGACTVVILRHKSVSIRKREEQQGTGNGLPYEIKAVNACLMPLIAVHGAQIITVEGIGNASNPHAIQQRLAFLFGSQCGFCTPGIIMSFYATLRNAGKNGLSEREIERSMDGNLCRCTGYRPILDALKTFAKPLATTPDSNSTEGTSCDWELDAIQAKRRANNDAIDTFTCPKGEDCCRVKNRSASPSAESSTSSFSSGHDSGFASSTEPLPKSSLDLAKLRIGSSKAQEDDLLPYEASSEPIFPPWLCKVQESDQWGRSKYEAQDLAFIDVSTNRESEEFEDEDEGDHLPKKHGTIWLRPSTVSSLLSMIRFYSDKGQVVKMRSGDSECRIEVKFLKRQYNVNIFVGNLPSLSFVKRSENELSIGANIPLQDVMGQLRILMREEKADYAKQVYRAILSNAAHFASTQIRNVACIGGNVATASPISDLNPVWMAVGATVNFLDACSSTEQDDDNSLISTTSKVAMSEFFKGYRKTALPSSGVITHLTIPLQSPISPSRRRFVRAYKQAKRKDDDIAIVTCCLYVDAEQEEGKNNEWKIIDARLAYGGMAPTTVFAKATQDALKGQIIIVNGQVNHTLLSNLLDSLSREDFDLKFGVPGGMAVYRKSLALGFLVKFIAEMADELQLNSEKPKNDTLDSLPSFDQIAYSHLQRPITRGSQHYDNPVSITKNGSGASVPNLSALKQCTGEAEYVDDHAPLSGELAGALVLTTQANATILSIDPKPALIPHGGPATHFVGLEDSKKLGGKNKWGPPAFDDHFFCDGFSEAVGLVVGVVLAPTRREALDAARMVKVEYESVGEPILDIDGAIAKESFFSCRPKIQQGDSKEFDDWSDCDHVIEGETRLGGQEHFYLETNAVLCIPGKEDQQMEIWSSTQNPNETQAVVADIINVPTNRITARTKRLGGGFGGKESRSCVLAAPMALASYISGKPVRCMLDRDEDIAISGQRHPFKSVWKLGFMKDGRVRKLDAKVYNNGGWSQDLSRAVVERAMTHIDGIYRFDAMRIHGFVCKTNTVSNTAFRGFGGPQGVMIIEDAMERAARSIGLPTEQMRLVSMSKEGDPVHYGQKLLDFNIPQMWETITKTSDFKARRKAVDQFNSVNRWKKRGISINGTRFGISFTALHLNQARVLIHIYAHDGSIMLSHAGTEMGQGLNTKVAQICSTELGVPLEKIHIAHTSTREVANGSPTAASASSDLNGAACKDACDQLNERLAPFKKDGKTFEQAVHNAYFARVNLSAVGHYRTDVKGMDWEEGKGEPFAYWTQGVSVAEAEIDVLTGDSRIVRTDIIMDIARSINPGIDVGQIEGAVMQGIGLVTTEESLWRKNSSIVTTGPGNYKIPAFLDTPGDMRISFMKRDEGRKAHFLKTVQGSKGIGEPPLSLGAFHFFAIKDAIASAREDAGYGTGAFVLHSPATPERIRLACADEIVKKAQVGAEPSNSEEKGFFVSIM